MTLPSDHGDARTSGACSCVAPLTPPADRLAALRDVLATEAEPLVGLTHLLRLCRDEHPTLWEHHADPRCRARIATLLSRVVEALPDPGTESVVAPRVREALAAALTPIPDTPAVAVAHAIAELLDTHYGHSFTDWFRHRSPYQPAVGDPIPLDSPDLRRITDMSPTAPPWRLANRLDETRRVRLAGAWTTQFRVVFDYGAFDALAGLITADTVLATCHPNHDLTEFTLPRDRQEPAFPIRPTDLDAQRDRINGLLSEATGAGAQVVVLPELCVTEELAFELEAWVRRPGPLRLLVAGSFHHADAADPARRANRALAWVRGHPAPLIYDKHSPADRPVIEDITPPGWPELRVYVTADGWHLVIAICRDLLNPHAVHALTEAGANLVLAPSMSETLVSFGGPVAQLVGSGQALVAVANNPSEWSDPDDLDEMQRPARALFGHPGFGQQTRLVQAPDRRRGLALLRVRAGRLGWYPAGSDVVASGEPATEPDQDGPPPSWVHKLRERTALPAASAASSVTLRAAAVLVLVTDGPDRPHVLLTGRAPDLTHYPGQLVFPGGMADPGDRGPVDTALREAREEIGLDPTSVHIIGTLSPFGLPTSGFLVTPVLAWSSQPRFMHPANLAEVTTVRSLPVGYPVAGTGRARPVDDTDSGTAAPEPSVGVMTATVLELLAAHLGLAGPIPEESDAGSR
jgi:8-oxo-dGTP pyrophosphatase MutT (NUDIX family)